MKKVLIIDDNQQFISLVKEMLSDYIEFECCSEFNIVSDIIEKIILSKPDVILLDINLGKFSGIDVLREMKKFKDIRDIPVIVLTASDYNSPTENLVRNEKNVFGFYSKLESVELIKEKIDNIVKNREKK